MKASRKTMHLGASAQIFKNAESLRNKTTLVEDLLWNHLRDRKFEGLKFRRQHPLKQYVSDFYCHELKLIIELDGLHHNKRHIEFSDNERSVALMNEGLHIIRFTNSASRFDIENSLTLLREKVKTLKALKGKRLNKRKII